MFSCPNCGQVLGEYPARGILVVACARCMYRYEVTGGIAVAMHSSRIELSPARERARAVHIRRSNLSSAYPLRRETTRRLAASAEVEKLLQSHRD